MVQKEHIKQNCMEAREALIQTFYTFAGMLCGEMSSLDTLADDIVGIGMGEQGYYKSKSDFQELIKRSWKAPDGKEHKTTIEYGDFDIRFSSDSFDHATLAVEMYITTVTDGQITKSNIIQMANAKKENGKWLFNLLTAAPLALSKESIEAYPLAFADQALSHLKGELQNETFHMMNENFSGGIIGTYMQSNYPLYFANDAMIKMLGYERNEFYEKFKDNTEQINYTGDKDFMHEFSVNAQKSDEKSVSTIARWLKKDGSYIWVEICVRKTKDDYGNDIFLSVIIDITEIMTLRMKAEEQNRVIMDGIEYASRIQRNLLPTKMDMANAFSDYSVIWEPRDVVGGDIYWLKQDDSGTVLCVCDCTGHGTPGALLTTLVVSALENAVRTYNCHDTAEIIWRLEQRLVSVFNVQAEERKVDDSDIKNGCDLAVLFIAKDKSITLSSGHTNVFICDGESVRRIKGQRIYVGEGKLTSKEEIETIYIPANPNHKFYIASDGMFDQPGGECGISFGYRVFDRIILDYHSEKQSVISDKIWEAFEDYRGDEIRVDDFELITFKP